MSDTAIIDVRGISREVFVDRAPRTILNNISLSFTECGIYSIMGPSGSGKSSLLRLLNRLDEPSSGEILFHNRPLKEYAPTDLRRRIGYLFQTPYLFPGTVADNLKYADDRIDDSRMSRVLSQVRLKPEIASAPVDNMSGGERQRIALARLLALEPEVILLDEPTSALDPTATASIERLITSIAGDCGLTAILVTHDPEQARRVGGEAILLAEGQVVETGTSEQLVTRPQTEIGQKFVSGTLT